MSGNDAERHRAFIALGSNIDPERNLPLAVEQLRCLGEIMAVSNVYESPPADGSNQPHYLNAAVLLLTNLSAETLCQQALPDIENNLGRVRDTHDRNAARTIDLDLVLYEDRVLTVDHRLIPDPEITERAFLVVPLAELDGAYIHPTLEVALSAIAEVCDRSLRLIRRTDVLLNR